MIIHQCDRCNKQSPDLIDWSEVSTLTTLKGTGVNVTVTRTALCPHCTNELKDWLTHVTNPR